MRVLLPELPSPMTGKSTILFVIMLRNCLSSWSPTTACPTALSITSFCFLTLTPLIHVDLRRRNIDTIGMYIFWTLTSTLLSSCCNRLDTMCSIDSYSIHTHAHTHAENKTVFLRYTNMCSCSICFLIDLHRI